jgi:hypothetical protein
MTDREYDVWAQVEEWNEQRWEHAYHQAEAHGHRLQRASADEEGRLSTQLAWCRADGCGEVYIPHAPLNPDALPELAAVGSGPLLTFCPLGQTVSGL